MKKKLLLFLISILSINCYTQISYEKGYFIDNNNLKTVCFIKNLDWKNNPKEFEYSLTENGDSETKTINLIEEFGIDNVSKYSRTIVNIDRSSDILNNLSLDRNPIYKEEVLFLKVLVEGNANLYQYADGNIIRYFYSKENSKIEQLVFKKFLTQNGNVGVNNFFRQQILNDLNCAVLNLKKIENLDYKKNVLIRIFADYNSCKSGEGIIYEKKEKKNLFNLTLRPRFSSSSLEVSNSDSPFRNVNFDKKTGFGFGIETELILPFNKNKWSIAIEPTYRNYESAKKTYTTSNQIPGGELSNSVVYNSIEVPFSIRHYFFITNNSKIFINASFIYDFASGSSIEFSRAIDRILTPVVIKNSNNLGFGFGFKQNDKYSLEFRYQTSRNLSGDYIFWDANYKSISLIFGYTIF